ncbi:MAG: anti-sigma factor domain-containing protein [Streptosporangiaceae bacterium]
MPDLAREHGRFDELAAGHALHSLDAGDEREFMAHLPGCQDCQEALAGYNLVAADLTESWLAGEPAQPPARLGERISAAVASEEAAAPVADITSRIRSAQAAGSWPPAAAGSRPAPNAVPPGPAATQPGPAGRAGWSRRRRMTVLGGSLAAGIALIAGGVLAGRLASEPAPRPAAACVRANACHEVALIAPGTATTTARVIVRHRAVWVVPTGLRPDDRARQIYVLWQITTGRKTVAVGTFDVRAQAGRPVRIGSLAVGYHLTRAFAVSLEHGRTAPPSPSSPVAAGLVLS